MHYGQEELEYDTWIVRLASNVNSHKSPLIGTSNLSTLLSFFHSLTILLYRVKSVIMGREQFANIFGLYYLSVLRYPNYNIIVNYMEFIYLH